MNEQDETSDDPTVTQDSAVGELGEEEIRERSQALDEAQTVFEELYYLSVPKMPCPECSGSGAVSGGSLGDQCPTCGGRRVIEQPGAPRQDGPPFAEMRLALSAYGNALADRALPAGHLGKRFLPLPPATSVPTLERIQELHAAGTARARQLAGGGPGLVDERLLREARPAAEDGDLSVVTDAEIDGPP